MRDGAGNSHAPALSAAFVALVPHAADADVERLEARLAELHAEGQARWPKLRLSPEAFVRQLGQVVKAEADVADALAQTRGADFYLAVACLARVPGAERAFAGEYFGRIAAYVARIDARPAFVDEVTQEMSLRLFVANAPGETPKIALYNGRGALAGFVRTATTRVAQNLKRGKEIVDRLDTAKEGQEPARDLDPEVLMLKKRFAVEFDEAFERTVAQLSREERNVLKLHYLKGLSVEEVGLACNVSRATAARWLSKARTRIVQLTYKTFAEAAGPNSASPQSMLALVKSELGATVARYFDSEASPDDDG